MDGFVCIGGDWVGWQTEGIRPGNLKTKKYSTLGRFFWRGDPFINVLFV